MFCRKILLILGLEILRSVSSHVMGVVKFKGKNTVFPANSQTISHLLCYSSNFESMLVVIVILTDDYDGLYRRKKQYYNFAV